MRKTTENLVPSTKNPSPDYYCTWQTQLYASCDGKPHEQRRILSEKALFAKEKPFGWAYFYEYARSDLIFVMDDSWDVPLSNDPAYYGSLMLAQDKFPEVSEGASPTVALKKLTSRMEKLGWKGLGGWVCAQESNVRSLDHTESYWIQCLKEANEAGFSYWKVDWGSKCEQADFRRRLTELGRLYAPRLVIEHAKTEESLLCGDVFRTYDVPALLSIPMTMEKLQRALSLGEVEEGAGGLLNCEDEVYMAAAGGFTMGVMRHPYSGNFTNGRCDMSFPSLHRNVKSKTQEVVRAVRFHRIAPAFAVSKRGAAISDHRLQDTWYFENMDEEIESWWPSTHLLHDKIIDRKVTLSAPAMIARNCPLPTVTPDKSENVPFVIAAKNPNGVFSILTCGRTQERSYGIPRCKISAEIGCAEVIGVFGEYEALTLVTDGAEITCVLAQDLSSDAAFDITDEVGIENGKITVSGDLIHTIGCESNPEGDTSEPGLLIKILRK